MKASIWKPLLTIALLALSLYSALPFKEKINLGLDLQGGMHLIMEVGVDKATANVIKVYSREIKSTLRKKDSDYNRVKAKKNKLYLSFYDPDSLKIAEDLIKEEYQFLELIEKDDKNLVLRYTLKPDYQKEVENNAVQQAVETIRNRVDLFGVAEPTIQRVGTDRILIQLPGIQETERAIKLIGKTAQLEFKLVDDENSLEAALAGNIPEGDEILYQVKRDSQGNEIEKIPFLLKETTLLTGKYLTNAETRIDGQFNEPYVSITFNKEGTRLFAQITAENVKKRMAIILDNVVHSAPVIQEEIGGGRAQITGNFTYEEAHDLAIVLRAGSLPAPIRILENRTVGPSLGKRSIEQGITSIIWGGVLVIIFILFYYKLSGVIANFALALNLVFLMGMLAYFHATLTLPGIAGIILTIGMAVDANVLIFERIKEELRNKKSVKAAVESGFDKAFSTIIDANITTLLAAIILFQFGTGPIKGFAITLSIGICASLFTAIVLSRYIFDVYLQSKRRKTLSI